jgi:phosphoglycolate phosphatase
LTPPRLVVFDLDGTLIDSRRDLADSANAILAECGCRALEEEALGRMVGDGAATIVARAFAATGCPQPSDALERFLHVYNGRLLRHTRPYHGIPEALAALRARSALAVLTNKPLHATQEILNGLALSEYFPAPRVLGGDGPFPRKPDPSGLLFLASQCGVSPRDTVLIGDSIVDWRTARAAGTSVCLARYGFGFAEFPEANLTVNDRVVDAPSMLIEALY